MNQFWKGFFTTIVFVGSVVVVLGSVFLVVSLLAGTPGS